MGVSFEFADFPSAVRFLQQEGRGDNSQQGRTILTIMYLTVLGCCFLTPILYYCRLRCEDRRAVRLSERMMIEGMAASAALGDAEHDPNVGEESRAAQRKYMEERRARILQLFRPVRVVRVANEERLQMTFACVCCCWEIVT
jgi:hypothetical protein